MTQFTNGSGTYLPEVVPLVGRYEIEPLVICPHHGAGCRCEYWQMLNKMVNNKEKK